MDLALVRNETRQLAKDLRLFPVPSPKRTGAKSEIMDHLLYKKRNKAEQHFRRFKGFRRIFRKFDMLDVLFTFFVDFALIKNALN